MSRPADDAESIIADRLAGHAVREIAERYGWSQSAINKIIGKAGLTDCQEYDPSPEEMSRWCERHLGDLKREHGGSR